MTSESLWPWLLDTAAQLTTLAGCWLLQSTLILGLGLAAGAWARGRGPAWQSAIYRTALAFAALAPLAASLLSASGLTIAPLRLPSVRVATLVAVPVEPQAPATTAASEPQIAIDQLPTGPHLFAGQLPTELERDGRDLLFDVARDRRLRAQRAAAVEPIVVADDLVLDAAPAAPATIFDIPPEEPAQRLVWTVRPYVALAVASVSLAWIFGTLALAVRLLRAYGSTMLLKHRSVPAGAKERRLCGQLAARLGVSAPPVLRSPLVSSPCLAGVIRRAILLPEEMRGTELSSVLLHELAHLKRGDSFWNLARHVVEAVLFFQPLVWRTSRALEASAEEVCDDYVVQYGSNPEAYAQALVTLAERTLLPASTAVLSLVTLRSFLSRRVVRILDRSRRLTVRVGLTALLAIVAIGLSTALVAGLLGPAGSHSQPTEQVADAPSEAQVDASQLSADESATQADSQTADSNSPAAASATSAGKLVSGRILAGDGRPAAGAQVVLAARKRLGYPAGRLSLAEDIVLLGQTRVDESGRFAMLLGDVRASDYVNVQLLARTPDSGMAWRDVNLGAPSLDFSFTLPTATTARGRLITSEGQPAAGIRLKTNMIGTSSSGQFHGINLWRPGLAPEIWPPEATTDADGKFAIPGVPPEVGLYLECAQEPFAPHSWMWQPGDVGTHTQVLEPAQLITGVVVAEDTGLPLGHARLTAFQAWDVNRGGMRGVHAEADDEGRFRLNPYTANGFVVTAFNPAGTPYLSREQEFDWPATAKEHEMRIKLPRGVLLHGTIAEAGAGKPVAGATVRYEPADDNTLRDRKLVTGWQAAVATDVAGRYSIAIPPGPGHITVLASDEYVVRQISEGELSGGQPSGPRRYVHAHSEFDIDNDTAERALDLSVTRGVTVAGDVVYADGSRPERVLITYPGMHAPYDEDYGNTPREALGGHLALHGVPADGELSLCVMEPQRKQGCVVTVRGSDAGQLLRIAMTPCGSATARYVDPDGRPVAGAQPTLDIVFTPGRSRFMGGSASELLADEELLANIDRANFWDLMSGADGRVEFAALVPGMLYRTNTTDEKGDWSIEREIRVTPGQRIDLGDLVVRNSEALRYYEQNWAKHQEKAQAVDAAAGNTMPAGNAAPAAMTAPAAAMPASSTPRGTESPAPLAPGGRGVGGEGAGEQVANAAPQQAAPAADNSTFHYRGQVVDPSGKPVAGAKLYLVYWISGALPDDQLKPLAISDTDGWFTFAVDPSSLHPLAQRDELLASYVFATAAGFGFAARPSVAFEVTGNALARMKPESRESFKKQKETSTTLRLSVDDAPLVGRIVSTENQPMPGVRIRVHRLQWNENGDLAAWEAAAKSKQADLPSLHLHVPNTANGPQLPSIIGDVLTDVDGRFLIKGIGRERLAELIVSRADIETAEVYARTRDAEQVSFPRYRDGHIRESDMIQSYHGRSFSHVAGPSKSVRGRILDAETGTAIAGAKIEVTHYRAIQMESGHASEFASNDPWIAVLTDREGNYQLDGLGIGLKKLLKVIPPPGSAYLPTARTITNELAGRDPQTEFKLRAGVIVRGTVTDPRLNEPIQGEVSYSAFSSNQHLSSYPGFRSSFDYTARTDSSGRFEITVLPGPGVISFRAHDYGSYRRDQGIETLSAPDEYIRDLMGRPAVKVFQTVPIVLTSGLANILQPIEPAIGAEPIEIKFAISSGVELTVDVLGPEGQPLSHTSIIGAKSNYGWVPYESSHVQVTGYFAEEPRDVIAYHAGRNLAGQLRIEGSAPSNLTLKLEAAGTIRGRLVDNEGQPLPNARVTSVGSPQPHNGSEATRQLKTDDQGRFELSGLVAGRKYSFAARDGAKLGAILHDVVVSAGEIKDLGDLKVMVPDQMRQAAADAQPKPPANNVPQNTEARAAQSPTPLAPGGRGVGGEGGIAQVVANAQQQPPAAEETLTIRGTVLDPAGKPVPGAEVRLSRNYKNSWVATESHAPRWKVQADAEGRFAFEYRQSQYEKAGSPDDWRRFSSLLAAAPGFGAAYLKYPQATNEEVQITLPASEPIEGRVVSLEGRPLAGVRVNVEQIGIYEPGSITPWLDALRSGLAYDAASQQGLRKSLLSFQPFREIYAITGDDGTFRLDGLARDHIGLARVSGGGVTIAALEIVARPTEPITVIRSPSASFPTPRKHATVYGSRFDFAAEPSQPIEGTVLDAQTRQPLAGVRVVGDKTANEAIGYRLAQTTTDEQGRYRLEGMPKGPGNRLAVLPAAGQAYFARDIEVPAGAGFNPVKIDVEVHPGQLVTGHVIDKLTGRGLENARVYYVPHPDNQNYQGLTEFTGGYLLRGTDPSVTDAQGNYRIVCLPGRGYVEVLADGFPSSQGMENIIDLPWGPDFQKIAGIISAIIPQRQGVVTAIKEVRLEPRAAQAVVDFSLSRGRTITLQVVDAQGQPAKELRAAGLKSARHFGARLELGPSLGVESLDIDEERLVILFQPERKLTKALVVSSNQLGEQPISVQLEPGARVNARLLDRDGEPVRRGVVRIDAKFRGASLLGIAEVATDQDGNLKDVLLPAECEMTMLCDSVRGGGVFASLSLRTGETRELGDLDVTVRPPAVEKWDQMLQEAVRRKQQQPEANAKPAEEMAGANDSTTSARPDSPAASGDVAREVAISGTVLDPAGKPVRGAKVFFISEPDNTTPFETGVDGRFKLALSADSMRRHLLGPSNRMWLVATAPGYGVAWDVLRCDKSGTSVSVIGGALRDAETTGAPAAEKERPSELVLRLAADDVPLTGRIVDLEGRPVAGAKVTVLHIRANAAGTMDQWTSAVEQKQDFWSAARKLPEVLGWTELREIAGPSLGTAITASDGSFGINGVGRERLVSIMVEGKAIETREFWARTQAGRVISIRDTDGMNAIEERVLAASFDYAAAPGRTVAGVVRDKDTGKPLAGVIVRPAELAGQPVYGGLAHYVHTKTDATGRYRLSGIPIGKNSFTAHASDEPYLPTTHSVQTPVEAHEAALDFPLQRGVWVRGRITDGDTGIGLPFGVQYFVFRDNSQLAMMPGRIEMLPAEVADTAGNYRIAVLPGRGIVGVQGSERYPRGVGADKIAGGTRGSFPTDPYLIAENVHALVEVNPTADDKEVVRDFQLFAGKVIAGNVVDPEGKPLLGAMISCQEFPSFEQMADPAFEVRHLKPGESRRLLVYHPGRQLAGSAIVKADQIEAIEIRTQPAGKITGRVLKPDGDPAEFLELGSGSATDAQKRLRGLLPSHQSKNTTGEDGRFTIEGLAAGVPYALSATQRVFYLGTLVEDFEVGPGETKDLGDLKLKRFQP